MNLSIDAGPRSVTGACQHTPAGVVRKSPAGRVTRSTPANQKKRPGGCPGVTGRGSEARQPAAFSVATSSDAVWAIVVS
jgi:hypothetical protein